jgi:hypothetical protein
MTDNTYCRVCGFDHGTPTWHEARYPDYGLICSCCGAQVGLDDISEAGVRHYRMVWLENGANWFSPKRRPADWDLFEQMKHIPDGFK